jgi:hypothetical protein
MKSRSLFLAAMLAAAPAHAHDIYSNLRMKDGTLPCCGGPDAGAARDCWRTIYRERGSHFQFKTNSGDWVEVPTDRIQFTPIPGDKNDDGETHAAHLCYRDDAQTIENYHEYHNTDRLLKTESGKEIVFYCGIITPGGI